MSTGKGNEISMACAGNRVHKQSERQEVIEDELDRQSRARQKKTCYSKVPVMVSNYRVVYGEEKKSDFCFRWIIQVAASCKGLKS